MNPDQTCYGAVVKALETRRVADKVEINHNLKRANVTNLNLRKFVAQLDHDEIVPREADIADERAAKDGAYRERNQLVAVLSKLFPASLEEHTGESFGDEWKWVVVIDTPQGQASWHIHARELHRFDHLERRQGRVWDGHTTEEKYARLEAIPVAREKS